LSKKLVIVSLFVAMAIFALLPAAWAGGPSPVALERVIAAQEKHTAALLAIKGVTGTAAGLEGVIVLLETLDAAHGVPANLDGIPVVIAITGEIRALSTGTMKYDRPVPIGVSTGNQGECSAGTISCRVTDGINVYALSNNHVYALENKALKGSNIVQPGLYDTGCVFDAANVIGSLYDFEPIVFSRRASNKIDAAIALCTTQTLSDTTPADGYGAPSPTVVSAALDQPVLKYGRTTGLTAGQITGVNATVLVSYSSGKAQFVDQIIVQSSGAFLVPGDSGSLLVTDPDLNPVGLLYAGNQTGDFAIANRIDLVLQRFGVAIGGTVTPVTDIAVAAVSAPASVAKGFVVPVNVTVKNAGNQNVANNITVTLRDQTAGALIGTQTVTGGLSAGATATLAFSWNTAGASIGNHTLTAAHDYGDGSSANNSASTVVNVKKGGRR